MIKLISLTLGCAFLVAAVYGGQISEDQQAYSTIKGSGLVVSPENALINTDPEPSLCCGFVDLFHGENLEGWTPRVGYSTYEVRDGVIVGTCVPGSRNTYLSTDKEDYRDFIFTAELKWAVDGNSGIMFRAQRKPGKKYEVVYGPQCEMEGFAKGRGWSGGIYGQSAGGWIYPLWLDAHSEARRALKEATWNRITIQAIGNEVKTWINGIPAAHWIDKDGEYREGFFGLQVHSGEQGEIHFRNIKVRELKPNSAALEGCHTSSGICHLSNVSYKMEQQSSPDQVKARMSDYEDLRMTAEAQLRVLEANEADWDDLMLGPKLSFNPNTESFTGEHASEANQLLRYDMREEFAVPEQV